MCFALDVVEQEDGSVAGRKFSQSAIQRNPINRPAQPYVVHRTCIENGAFAEVIAGSAGIERNRFYMIGSQPHQYHVDGQAI